MKTTILPPNVELMGKTIELNWKLNSHLSEWRSQDIEFEIDLHDRIEIYCGQDVNMTESEHGITYAFKRA